MGHIRHTFALLLELQGCGDIFDATYALTVFKQQSEPGLRNLTQQTVNSSKKGMFLLFFHFISYSKLKNTNYYINSFFITIFDLWVKNNNNCVMNQWVYMLTSIYSLHINNNNICYE